MCTFNARHARAEYRQMRQHAGTSAASPSQRADAVDGSGLDGESRRGEAFQQAAKRPAALAAGDRGRYLSLL
jgi:hypothetical protein